jgi:hypothetical protein
MPAVSVVGAAFGTTLLVDITADSIDLYLRERLRQHVRVKATLGYKQLGAIKSTTIHQEFRVLRRMLNVAVCKKLLASSESLFRCGVPCCRERIVQTTLRYVV